MSESYQTMKAAYAHKTGDPLTAEVTSVVDKPVPEPKKGEILIKVHAAAINPVDWKLIEGLLPGYRGGPIGFDVSGVVESIGPDTETDIKVGDEVYGDLAATKGSFAEYALAKEEALAKKPTSIDMKQAAALPLAGLTAVQGLKTHGQMKKDDKVLILGGSGGVGSLAIQTAKALGASEVFATGSDVKMIKSFGADVVVNYKNESLLDTLRGREFDVVYDTIGGYEHWKVAKEALKPSGRFITIVGDGGSLPMTLFSIIWRKLYAMYRGPYYHFFLTDTSAPAVVKDMKTISELVEKGSLKPVLDGTSYDLSTPSLHEMIRTSKSHRAKGKLVMKISDL